MKLFVHIGTNKTGSSYLQSTITLNKKILQESGVYVPDSKWDDKMIQGVITPGNGHELAKILVNKNTADKLFAYLNQIRNAALNFGCEKVLLSNEILIRIFSEPQILNDFETASQKAGFEEVHCLTFLRNLYGHALSLYKHRAKSGKNENYKTWFESDYETLRLFNPLMENLKNSKLSFKFVPFEKDSKKIIQRFSEWIVIENHKLKLFENSVNPSLTLNQIKWLQHINKRYEGIGPELYAAMIGIQNSEENEHLISQFYDDADAYFQNYTKTIDGLNDLMHEMEHEPIDKRPNLKTAFLAKKSNLLSLSEYDTIQGVVKKYSRFYQLNRTLFLMKHYGRIGLFNLIGKKKNNLDSNKFGGSLRN